MNIRKKLKKNCSIDETDNFKKQRELSWPDKLRTGSILTKNPNFLDLKLKLTWVTSFYK